MGRTKNDLKEYVKPENVISPKKDFRLLAVLADYGENSHSIAIGWWKNEIHVFIRNNGNKVKPLGNPQSRGLPSWFRVPQDLAHAFLGTVDRDGFLSDGDKVLINHFFPKKVS